MYLGHFFILCMALWQNTSVTSSQEALEKSECGKKKRGTRRHRPANEDFIQF